MIEILAEAGRANSQLARERQQGAQQVGNANAIASAISALVPALGGLGQKALEGIDAAQVEKVKSVLADEAANVGGTRWVTPDGVEHWSGASIPEATAAAVARREDLQPIKPTGDAVADFFADPFSIASRARSKANTAARLALSQQYEANRERLRQRNIDDQKLQSTWAGLAQKAALAQQQAAQQERHFSLGREDKAAEREMRQSQFDQRLGLDRSKIGVDGSQFGQRMSLEREKIEAANERARLNNEAREKARENKDKSRPVSSGDASAIADINAGLALFDRIEMLKKTGNNGKPIPTGKVNAAGSWIADKFGEETPSIAEFRSAVGEGVATFIKSISGAVVSESERAALMKIVPSFADSDDVFLAKLRAVRTRLRETLGARLKSLGEAGYDVSRYTTQAAQSLREGSSGGSSAKAPAGIDTLKDIANRSR